MDYNLNYDKLFDIQAQDTIICPQIAEHPMTKNIGILYQHFVKDSDKVVKGNMMSDGSLYSDSIQLHLNKYKMKVLSKAYLRPEFLLFGARRNKRDRSAPSRMYLVSNVKNS